MNRLRPAGITAWSWVSALGRAHATGAELTAVESISAAPLSSHESELGIAGYSGRYPGELPPLPPRHRHRDSRCARLLYEALTPLMGSIAEARDRYGAGRVAIVLGSSTGGIDATEVALRQERKTGKLPDSYRFRDVHPYDSLLELVREVLEVSGPAVIVSTACSSGGKALASAQRLLHAGFADAALVGGADALCEMTVRGFAGLGVLSDEPCRPFEAGRSGISIGEGAALLLLDSRADAPVHFLGSGESSDAYHATAPHPEGVGAEMSMRDCLLAAGLAPGDVDYLNAHGTGTDKNDAMEANAISRVLGPLASFTSTKSLTGHQLGTAGATEAIICARFIVEGSTPDLTPRVRDLDAKLAVFPRNPARDQRISAALSNSFAFGGSNVTVALGKLQGAPPPPASHLDGCYLQGVALWSSEYESAEAWLGGTPTTPKNLPPAELLPARARGRASILTRIFAELYGQLQRPHMTDPSGPSVGIPTIYGSCFGEMETTLKLLDQMDEEPRLSPIRFQASVHNTASGRISLETKNRAFSTALSAGESTLSMALLEAQAWLDCHGGEILVLVADEELPERLDPHLRFPPLGVGLHLSAKKTDESRMRLSSLAPIADQASTPEKSESRFSTYQGAPSRWGLALVDAWGQRLQASVRVGRGWETTVEPLGRNER